MRLPGYGMGLREFFSGMKEKLGRDDVTDIAATVTYWGVLSLFPFLLFLVALVSVLITPSDVERLLRTLAQVAPPAVTQILAGRIRDLASRGRPSLLGLGALGAVWAASGGILSLMSAFNKAYEVKEGRPFWKVRLIAIGMTLISGALALVAALVVVAAAPLASSIHGPPGKAIALLRLPLGGLLTMFLWALAYYVLPDVEQRFKFITPGSVLGVVLWVAASWGFSLYVQNFGNYDLIYGPLAGVVVLLLWMWISALALIVGAEVNAFIEHRSPDGKRPGAKSMADQDTRPVLSRNFSEKANEVAQIPLGSPRPVPTRGVVALLFGFLAGILVGRRSTA